MRSCPAALLEFLRSPRRLSALLLVLLLAWIHFGGCAPLPGLREIGASFNRELRESHNQSPAMIDLEPPERYFIGLALSGGGSRAANFSASVMWELHDIGILRHVQYISAVSGSALPAAYYALFKEEPRKWTNQALREATSQCFECWAFLYLLNPIQLVRFLGTSYDRSDLMSRVFANRVFAGKRFSDLTASRPRLLLNATNYVTGEPFVFENDRFDRIRSDLKHLLISDAVMASAAYPGGFRNVTLKDFVRSAPDQAVYVHLFDGGISDNLGIDTLLRVHQQQVTRLKRLGREAFPDGCLFILVDAYSPYLEDDAEREPDTRVWYDIVIDSNVANASSIMLLTKRTRALRSLGFDIGQWVDAAESARQGDPRPIGLLEAVQAERLTHHPDEIPREDVQLILDKRRACKVWHVALTQIGLAQQYRPPGYPDLPEFYREDFQKHYATGLKMDYEQFSKQLRGIATRFSISPSNVEHLYTAGRLLVRERNTTQIVCGWLRQLRRGPEPECGVPPEVSR